MSSVLGSLILTLAGGVLAMLGSLLTQLTQARNARVVRTEQYAREDSYRLFDKRQEAYTTLYLHLGAARRALAILSSDSTSDSNRAQARSARNKYWEAYTAVRLIGSEKVFEVADELLRWIDTSIDCTTFDHTRFRGLLGSFTSLVRTELLGDAEATRARPATAPAVAPRSGRLGSWWVRHTKHQDRAS